MDSPLSLLLPQTPIYSPAQCPSTNTGIGEGWIPPAWHQLPSPPATPLLTSSTECGSDDLQLTTSVPQTPLRSPNDFTTASLSPFACQSSPPVARTPLPTSPDSRLRSGPSRLADCDIGESEEGLRWYAKLRDLGLNSFEIRYTWKYVCKVPWKQIAKEERTKTKSFTPQALSMRLQRLKAKHPRLRQWLPSSTTDMRR